ncbi:hypothetical protein CEUSTIGMA_g3597.t1 [Chlamydomonas eustigma]|uniref:Uncharacterized protein n=1 Tax=Chlamydomonas eustigma TaxID=1157962 RepID=A0A250WZ86_9CHLO|nr:hypothetical protein CEUSTIGMA_g3597.t1 [Chlamydomonas eustigma]|eukprot:GAX76153.1 hypothetical protein CEUSTIGMA_g3597.t1 [Chlamydomonas eustigma]
MSSDPATKSAGSPRCLSAPAYSRTTSALSANTPEAAYMAYGQPSVQNSAIVQGALIASPDLTRSKSHQRRVGFMNDCTYPHDDVELTRSVETGSQRTGSEGCILMTRQRSTHEGSTSLIQQRCCISPRLANSRGMQLLLRMAQRHHVYKSDPAVKVNGQPSLPGHPSASKSRPTLHKQIPRDASQSAPDSKSQWTRTSAPEACGQGRTPLLSLSEESHPPSRSSAPEPLAASHRVHSRSLAQSREINQNVCSLDSGEAQRLQVQGKLTQHHTQISEDEVQAKPVLAHIQGKPRREPRWTEPSPSLHNEEYPETSGLIIPNSLPSSGFWTDPLPRPPNMRDVLTKRTTFQPLLPTIAQSPRDLAWPKQQPGQGQDVSYQSTSHPQFSLPALGVGPQLQSLYAHHFKLTENEANSDSVKKISNAWIQ